MATIPPNPDWFGYSGPLVSRSEGYPILTGTAFNSAPASTWIFNPMVFPVPVALSNINVFKSLNASVPGATSQASTGSEGYTFQHNVGIFKRQDWSANSTNLSCIGVASAGLTATLGYSSTSQQFGLSWNTDASGGTSAYTTTSNAGNWSSFVTGPKLFEIPVSGPVAGYGSTLSAGEYFFGHQVLTTSGTSNSNVTLLSVSRLMINPQVVTYGVLGGSVTVASSGQIGIGLGLATAATTNGTMAASVISAANVNLDVQNFSNA